METGSLTMMNVARGIAMRSLRMSTTTVIRSTRPYTATTSRLLCRGGGGGKMDDLKTGTSFYMDLYPEKSMDGGKGLFV